MANYASVQNGEWDDSSTWGVSGVDADTKLMIHFDGIPFTDVSDNAHTITNNNVTSVAGHFDNCGYFDNTASAYLSFPHHSDFDFQDQDWVIDFWFRGSTPGYNWPAIYIRSGSTRSGLMIDQETDNNLRVYIDSSWGGNDWDVGSAKLLGSTESGTFHHYALLRSGNDYYTFKDGVQQTTWSNAATLVYNSATSYIGLEGTTEYINGYLDEFRISVGTDRGWSGGFTPSTGPYGALYPNTDGDTVTITDTVTYSISADVELGRIDINSGGTLSFNPSANTYMEIVNNTRMYVNDGAWLSIGTSGAPVHKDYTAKLAFNCTTNNASGILTDGTGSMSFYGDPDYFGRDKETFMANDATGSTSITATDDMSSKWNIGDEIAIDKHEQYVNWTLAGTITTITGLSGNVIECADVISTDYNQDGIIVNLTRNVEIDKVGYNRGWYEPNTGQLYFFFGDHESQKWFSSVSFGAPYYIGQAHMDYYTNGPGKFSWIVLRNGQYGLYNSFGPIPVYDCIGISMVTCLQSNGYPYNMRDSISLASQRSLYGGSMGTVRNHYTASCSYGTAVALYHVTIIDSEDCGSAYNVANCYQTDFVDCNFYYGNYGIGYVDRETRYINCGIGVDRNGVSKPGNQLLRHFGNNFQLIDCLVSPSAGFIEGNQNQINIPMSYTHFENFNQVKGDHRTYSSYGNSIKVDADGQSSRPNQRTGGSSTLQEIETYSFCGTGETTPLYINQQNVEGSFTFRAFEHQLYLQADLQRTIRYYIQTDYVDLSSEKFYLGIVPMYANSSIQSSQSIATRANQSDWSQYVDVTTTPTQDGWFRFRVIVWGYESGKYIWIDPKPEVV